MLLVNTRTSGNATSASINELDPRGGAAVTGENSVGKTTTLELLPLFFGALPSQITETVGGREPMLKFVLPMPQSAIVFEYQRGSDEAHDVRCAILRRTDNDHRPVFRFIHGPFLEEAFIRVNESGERTFCDDRQTAQAYEALGVQVSQLLDIADYRAVILGLEARTQDAKKLRVLSTVYGFGSRLTNLDRLVAAVAKERVDFKDFVRLAVTIVQERLNSHGAATSRQRVTLRQSKEQIQRWLRDRNALEVAFSMTKDVDLLREAGKEHALAEAGLRAARQCVAPALVLRRDLLLEISRELSNAQAAQSEHASIGQARYQRLNDDLSAASKALMEAGIAVTAEVARRESLSLGEVQAWSSAIDRIPQLQNDHDSVNEQIKVLSGEAGAISGAYKDMIHSARMVATKTAAQLREGKEAVRVRRTEEAARMAEVHRQRISESEDEFKTNSSELSPRIEELGDARATLKAQIDSAQASKAAREALDHAQNDVGAAQDARAVAIQQASQATIKSKDAQRDFQSAEDALAKALVKLSESERLVSDAQARLTPADGTLLSALRSSPDTEWKTTLAKIIDPALLQRSDLEPNWAPDDLDNTAYGWNLQTQSVDVPSWTDDGQMRDALIQAQRIVSAAQEKTRAVTVALALASKVNSELSQAAALADAESSSAGARLEARKSALTLVKAACEQEIRALKQDGQGRLAAIERDLGELNTQMRTAQQTLHDTMERLRTGHGDALRENDRQQAIEIAVVEQDALAAEKRGEDSVERLQQDLNVELKRACVDPDRLGQLTQRATVLFNEIREAQKRRPTVDLWRDWLSEGGEQILAARIESHRVTENHHSHAQGELIKHSREFKDKQDGFTAQVEGFEKSARYLTQEVQELSDLLSAHGLSEVTTRDPDPDATVDDIKGDLARSQAKVDQCYDLISRRAFPIRDRLTGVTSSVSEFIQTHLAALPDGSSRIRIAEELCTLHKELGRQVLPNVINEASVILEQVRQFRGVITRFEAEVKRFNTELQKGLSVAHFKRIHDFKVAILSNFSDLDLMKEVDEIERVARDHEASLRVSDGPQLPDARTAGALTKFLALLRSDSTVDLDLASHVGLRGSVTINGETRQFSREADLEHISSTGINAIVLITLLVGMLNMIRGEADLFIPWISDEVGKFDDSNFKGLMDTLRENRIDPVTASPKLTPTEFRHFQHCYVFRDRGSVGMFAPAAARKRLGALSLAQGVAHEA